MNNSWSFHRIDYSESDALRYDGLEFDTWYLEFGIYIAYLCALKFLRVPLLSE